MIVKHECPTIVDRNMSNQANDDVLVEVPLTYNVHANSSADHIELGFKCETCGLYTQVIL